MDTQNTGQWPDLPERYGKWVHGGNTVLSMAKSWGLESNIRTPSSDACGGLFGVADQQGMLVVTVHYVDGTVVRAHQHAAGGILGQ